MKLDDMFPSQYLSARDIKGHQVRVTIAAFDLATLDDEAGTVKPVLSFVGKTKRMVLNRENANRLCILFGDDSDLWLGQQITLHVEQVMFRGQFVDGLRIMTQQQAPPAAAPAPQQPAPAQAPPQPAPPTEAPAASQGDVSPQSPGNDPIPF